MISLTQDMNAEVLREIGDQVNTLYSRGPFGRVLKTEIDGMLFGVYARHQHRLKRLTEESGGIISGRKMYANCRYACASLRVVLKPCWNSRL